LTTVTIAVAADEDVTKYWLIRLLPEN
jgi:hypothetical protein